MRGDRKLAFDHIIVSFAKKIFTKKRTCITLDHYASLRNVRLGGPVGQTSIFMQRRVIGFTRHFGGQRTVSGTLGRTRTSIRCMTTTHTFSHKSVRRYLRRFFHTVRSHCSVRGPTPHQLVHQGLRMVGALHRRGQRLGRRVQTRRRCLGGCTHRCLLVNGRYVARTRSTHTTLTGCSGTLRLCPSCVST